MRRSSWASVVAVIGLLSGPWSHPRAEGQESVIFSTSGDVSVPGFAGSDEDLLEHTAGEPAGPLVTSQGMAFLLGDLDGNGKLDDLSDVDAVSLAPADFPGAEGILVSFISDAPGIKDGDLIRFISAADTGGGGHEVVVSEGDLVAAIGAVDGNIDLDAAHFNPVDGSLIFSLAEDEDTTSLSGSTPGMVRDDEILYLGGGETVASVLYNADEISAAVAAALGVDPFDVKDVLAVTLGPTGEVWFSVQSPSPDDATVFSMGNGGTIVEGQRESDFGFEGSAEIDALARIGEVAAFGCVRSEPERPSNGAPARFEVWRGQPDGPFQVLLSAAVVAPTNLDLPGFGGLYLDPADALFAACLRAAPFFAGQFDASGHGRLDLPGPPDATAVDVAVQVLDLARFTISHPIWVEVNQ